MTAIVDQGLHEAASVVQAGGIIAYPTESCFGIGCDPANVEAIKKILQIKQRPREKGLIVIADRIERFAELLQPLTPEQLEKVSATWPGPFSWICPASSSVSGGLGAIMPVLPCGSPLTPLQQNYAG